MVFTRRVVRIWNIALRFWWFWSPSGQLFWGCQRCPGFTTSKIEWRRTRHQMGGFAFMSACNMLKLETLLCLFFMLCPDQLENMDYITTFASGALTCTSWRFMSCAPVLTCFMGALRQTVCSDLPGKDAPWQPQACMGDVDHGEAKRVWPKCNMESYMLKQPGNSR